MRDKLYLKEMSKLELELAEMLKQLSAEELAQYIKDKEEFLESLITTNLPKLAPILPHITAILPIIAPVLPQVSAILLAKEFRQTEKPKEPEI